MQTHRYSVVHSVKSSAPSAISSKASAGLFATTTATQTKNPHNRITLILNATVSSIPSMPSPTPAELIPISLASLLPNIGISIYQVVSYYRLLCDTYHSTLIIVDRYQRFYEIDTTVLFVFQIVHVSVPFRLIWDHFLATTSPQCPLVFIFFSNTWFSLLSINWTIPHHSNNIIWTLWFRAYISLKTGRLTLVIKGPASVQGTSCARHRDLRSRAWVGIESVINDRGWKMMNN